MSTERRHWRRDPADPAAYSAPHSDTATPASPRAWNGQLEIGIITQQHVSSLLHLGLHRFPRGLGWELAGCVARASRSPVRIDTSLADRSEVARVALCW